MQLATGQGSLAIVARPPLAVGLDNAAQVVEVPHKAAVHGPTLDPLPLGHEQDCDALSLGCGLRKPHFRGLYRRLNGHRRLHLTAPHRGRRRGRRLPVPRYHALVPRSQARIVHAATGRTSPLIVTIRCSAIASFSPSSSSRDSSGVPSRYTRFPSYAPQSHTSWTHLPFFGAIPYFTSISCVTQSDTTESWIGSPQGSIGHAFSAIRYLAV